MPRRPSLSTKKAATLEERARALKAKGLSLREIEKAMGGALKKSALGELFKTAGPGRPAAPPVATSTDTSDTADGPRANTDTGEVTLAFLEGELEELGRKVQGARDGTTRAYLDAVRGYAEIAERIRKMQPPPPPPSPDEDPANLAAKRLLREQLEALAEESLRTPEARGAVRAHLERVEAEAAAAVSPAPAPPVEAPP